MKTLKRSLVLATLMFVVAALAASAAAPVVNHGTAVVDGNDSEWTVTPTNSTNPDWFLATCNGGGSGGQANCASPTGDLFLRYNCNTNTLYILELADRGFAYAVDASANWVTVGGINNKVLVDSTPYTTNTTPPMWRDVPNGQGGFIGYEAAIVLAPGSYSMIFHAGINGTTSGSGTQTVTLQGCATAVTVSSISAETVGGGMNLAALMFGGMGLVVLGGLVMAAIRKH